MKSASPLQKMKSQIALGTVAGFSCIAMPYICRIPRGIDWVEQYLPDEENLIGGMLFFGAFAMIPAVVVFCAALLSKPKFFPPLLLSTLVALCYLAYTHHDNDLGSDAQAALTLVFIPIYAAGLAFIAGVVGLGFQSAIQARKKIKDKA